MSKSLGKNIIFKFILNLFNIGIPIILGPYIVRTLGANMLGNINFAQSVFGYFFIFANFGVYQFAIRELSKCRDKKDELSSIFTNLFCVTTITTIITMIVYIIIINFAYSSDKYLFLIFLIMTTNFISNIFYIEWANEALENYDFITIKTVLIKIIYVIFIFLLVHSTKDFKTYVTLMVISTFLNNIISYIYIKKRIKFNFKRIYFLRYIRPMFHVVLISNAGVLFTQLDIILIGQLVDKTSVAYYSSANTIMIMCNTLLISIVSVSLPRVSNYFGNGFIEEYEKTVNKIIKIFFIFLIPAAMGIFVLSSKIMLIYGGEEFANSGNLLKIFSVYMIILGFDYILANQIIYIQAKDHQLIKMILLSGILNVMFKFILIISNNFNQYTAILTTLFSEVILVLVEYYYVKKVMNSKIKIFDIAILKYFLISLSFLFIDYIINVININWITQIFLVVIISASTYIVTLILLKDKTIIYIISKIKIKIINKYKTLI